MDKASTIIAIIVGTIAIVGSLAAWYRKWKPRHEQKERDRIAQRDALIGRPPITDSITGKEISPALPGIGQRMASVEVAIAELAKSNLRHESHEKHLLQHDREIAELKQAAIERVVAKAESAAAWRAMEAVARPDFDYDAESDDTQD